jgi:hypothetical protein
MFTGNLSNFVHSFFVFRKIVDILTSDTLEVFELKVAEVVILIFKFP